MAVLIHTGVAGTGKTLYAIQKYLIPELKKGGIVYTNIDGIDIHRLAVIYDIDIIQAEQNYRPINDPKYFYKEAVINSLIIIDEAQNIFNNRDWKEQANNDCIKYIMEHRHYGHQVIFLTPAIDSVDAGIRRVVQFTYKHKSLSAIGMAKSVRCAVFDQCDLSRSPLATFSWKHDTNIYACYKSYFSEGTKETKPKVNIVSPLFIFMCFLTISLITTMIIMPPSWMKSNKKHKSKITKIEKDTIQTVKNYGKRILINDTLFGGKR